jgi:hypothetical protein
MKVTINYFGFGPQSLFGSSRRQQFVVIGRWQQLLFGSLSTANVANRVIFLDPLN